MRKSNVEIIRCKRDGENLTEEEIKSFIKRYIDGEIPDYQMAAFLMAVYFRGMTRQETMQLTAAMVASGRQVMMTGVEGIIVDKHSTGGVSDTTTLVVAPLVAAGGVPIAKMSGRGLGFTGGTIDKLESIPGFRVQVAAAEFEALVQQHGLAVMAQTSDIVPADGKMYALRDVTATVESIPLIASSVMSKKIAGGAQRILLDVKVGQGAFMRTVDQAAALAETMVQIGEDLGRTTVALLSSMDQPLGMTVGNRLEVLEALAVLRGEGPAELWLLCRELGAQMLVLGECSASLSEAREKMDELRRSGAGLAKFRQFVAAQGGDARIVDEPDRLALSCFRHTVVAANTGYISKIAADELGRVAGSLGAGRERKEDPIDPGAGIQLYRRLGDYVQQGEPLAELYTTEAALLSEAAQRLAGCYQYSSDAPAALPLLLGRVDRGGTVLY